VPGTTTFFEEIGCFFFRFDLRKRIFLIVLLLSILPVNGGYAQDHREGESKRIIVETLRSLGYEDIEIEKCDLKFSANLNNSCPSERPIRFERVIKLQHIPNDSGFIAEPLASTGGRSNILRFSPVDPYFSTSVLRFESFRIFIEEEFPGSDWPWSYDRKLPEIGSYFLDAFPDLESFSWWKFETCYGVSYSIDNQIGITGANLKALSDLGPAIQEYRSSKICSKN